jgi:hypothetical protein
VVYTFQTIFFLNQWFISTKGTIRNLIKDVQASGLFGRQYKILISLRQNLFQRWSSPKQYLFWALKQFDHMLARVRWRGKAHGDDNQLFSRTNELLHGTPAISATPSTVRIFVCKARSKPVPRTIQSKAISCPSISNTSIGCFRIMIEGDIQWPMDSRPCRSVLASFACRLLFKPVPKLIHYKPMCFQGSRALWLDACVCLMAWRDPRWR